MELVVIIKMEADLIRITREQIQAKISFRMAIISGSDWQDLARATIVDFFRRSRQN